MKSHAAILIKDEGGRVLFIKRAMKKKTLPGAWSFPSGTLEEGESISETTKREANEELGVNVEIEKVLAETNLDEFSVKLHFVLCKIISGKPFIKEPNEIDKMEFMTFQDFFNKFSDEEIGHGLIWLRKNPQVWSPIYNEDT